MRLNNIGIKKYSSLLFIFLLYTDLMILYDIPIYRQVFAFLCLSILPGWILLDILQVQKIKLFEKIVLGIGLSIFFVLFVGLVLNTSYMLLNMSNPLSLIPVVLFFNTAICLLIFINYKLNKDLNFKFDFKFDLNYSIVPISSIFFPALSVLGTYFMNTRGDNSGLIILLLSIPLYLFLVYYRREKINDSGYSFLLWMISLSLLLFTGLSSNYLYGRDVHTEFVAFETVVQNAEWSILKYHNTLTATLSTSLLPAIYKILTNITSVYVYKLYYPILFSFVPVVIYNIFNRYIGKFESFLASCLFIFQTYFIYESHSAMRQDIALIFFSLALMVLFANNISPQIRKLLLIIFIAALIISHYSTAYLFFILLFLTWIYTRLKTEYYNKGNEKKTTYISGYMLALFAVFIFFWYSLITDTHFTNLVKFVQTMFFSATDFFVEESRQPAVYQAVGGNLNNVPQKIYVTVHNIVFLFIGIGSCISIIYKKRFKFNTEYLTMVAISLLLLASMLILPSASNRYGMTRLFQQLVVIIGPMFVIGVSFLFNKLKIKYSSIFIIIILILQLFSASFLIYNFFGVPHSGILNHEGFRHAEFYIHDQEVLSANFLLNHKDGTRIIYGDTFSSTRFLYSNYGKYNIYTLHDDNITHSSGYFYMRFANTGGGVTFLNGQYDNILSFSDHVISFVQTNKIYDSDISVIYYR